MFRGAWSDRDLSRSGFQGRQIDRAPAEPWEGFVVGLRQSVRHVSAMRCFAIRIAQLDGSFNRKGWSHVRCARLEGGNRSGASREPRLKAEIGKIADSLNKRRSGRSGKADGPRHICRKSNGLCGDRRPCRSGRR